MTALSQYERLECQGVWRASRDAQRQNVIVSLGDASLIIRNNAEAPLAHWSLPATQRTNPGTRPALYTPGADAEEELEIDDETMIEAIATVHRAISSARPKPGLLRRVIVAGLFVAMLALGIFWLPGSLAQHTADAMPQSTRNEIGQRLLRQLEPVIGQPCEARDSRRVVTLLDRRLFGPDGWEVVVVPGGPVAAAHLPGRVLLLRRDLIEQHDTPDAAAGALLVEAARAELQDPMAQLTRHAGVFASFSLLTRGEISDAALSSYADRLLTTPRNDVPADALRKKFDIAGVSSEAFAALLPAQSALAQELKASNPHPDGSDPPVLSEAGWLRIQGICER